ncbi:uncharacterized protein [Montipora foliosa]|uniref:uncharacterized protein n=1 Tax=Montipora foliosa TaxID=591990 RepID=UPI0035F1C394
MDSVSFIQSLELEEHGPSHMPGGIVLLAETKNEGSADSGSLVSSTSKSEGLVDAGSLVSFTSEVGQKQKEDVLNSTLLAQLAANKKYDRFTDIENWYKFYGDVMSQLGWVMQNFKFNEYKSSHADFKISDVLVKLLSAMVGGDKEMMKVVKETLDALAKSGSSLTLFSSNSISEKNGNFQILPCTVDKSNQVSIAFTGGHFQASQAAKHYFFFSYAKKDISLFHSGQVFTLSEGVYDKVRDHVKEKLGKRAVDFVKNLDI